MRCASQNAATSRPVRDVQPPSPTIASGRSAPSSSSVRRAIAASPGGVAASGRCGAASGTSTTSVSMSSGSARTTGPGRPDVATAKARATSSGTRAASSICATHFAIDPNTAA